MIKESKKQMSETLVIGILLAITGGFLDAYSYINRGHVFATAETGNMVLLGINLTNGNFRGALHYIFPILAYAVGVIVAQIIRNRYNGSDSAYFHWRHVVIGIEILVLCMVAFIPAGEYDSIANILIAFICSMQVQTFRRFLGNPYATTMCTGNLRSGTEQMYTYIHTGNKAAAKKCVQYYMIIVFFIIGACAGVFLSSLFGVLSITFCIVVLLIVFTMMTIH